MRTLKAWLRRRTLRKAQLPDAEWRSAVAVIPLLSDLDNAELGKLRDLTILFLHEKSLIAEGGLAMNQEMRLQIAAQACLLILNLGLDYYRGWATVIVYPAGFLAPSEYRDAAGVVHSVCRPLIGEAWDRGPVILSWEDVQGAAGRDGYNVVVHEFAHKLDMLTGDVNGLPPLHRGMNREEWSRSFLDAYNDLQRCVENGLDVPIDPYAAENPGEFFAVASEVFFETPATLIGVYPEVYGQLAEFYRQDPLRRLSRGQSKSPRDLYC